jgi:hypothetical protein
MAPKIRERLCDPVTVTTGLESFFINPQYLSNKRIKEEK